MTAAAKILHLPERFPRGCGRSLLERYDKRWNCHTVLELSSESFDEDLLGVGSTPWPGDTSALGLRVPQLPTVDQSHRYLFRLCGIDIGINKAMRILGIWQYASLVANPPSRAPLPCQPIPLELEITSRNWKFIDGNISWHLRWEPNQYSEESVFDAAQLPGTSPTMNGLDSALLYLPPALPYTPPGAGIPPGTDVDYLGTWREMRYQDTQSHELSIPVFGPGRIVFYASVHQTDPDTRCPIYPVPIGIGRPEDQWLAFWESEAEDESVDVWYGRVAGGLAVEIFPCCDDLLKGHP